MASTYLSKTLGAPTNNKKFTFSCWVKKNAVASTMDIFHAGADGPNEAIMCRFESEGHITIKHDVSGSQEMLKQTNAKYRDPNAWYHIVTVFDTDNSTAEDRQRIYVNGERITEWLSGSDDNFSQGDDVLANKAVSHTIGKRNFDSAHYLDGCLSHVHFCDGQAYDASYFGSTDSTTGEWKINVAPSVTYGNNGFFILKDGNSVTDQSGNGNNWTVGGGTLTNTEDCPSNVFCTINPLIYAVSNNWTLANGNTAKNSTPTTNAWRTGYGTLGTSSGKYYFEMKVNQIENSDPNNFWVGIIDSEQMDHSSNNERFHKQSRGYGYHAQSGASGYNNNTYTYGNSWTTNDIIGVAMDLDNSKLYFHKNGTYQNSGVPTSGSTGTGAISIASGYTYLPAFSQYYGNEWFSLNFGNGYFQSSAVSSAGTNASNIGIFEYDVPAGYTALSTKGLNL